MVDTKLIILRGPSGSGKSTVAKEVRARAQTKTALIEQDYLRRIVLKEKEVADGANIELIFTVAKLALEHGYNVILEGILSKKRYATMIEQLLKIHPKNNHIYYFDISFEETLKRHITKPNSHEFGEKEMRDWYTPKDLLGVRSEQIIPETFGLEQTIEKILKDSGL